MEATKTPVGAQLQYITEGEELDCTPVRVSVWIKADYTHNRGSTEDLDRTESVRGKLCNLKPVSTSKSLTNTSEGISPDA